MQEQRGKSWLHVFASLKTTSFAKLICVLPSASSLLGAGKRGETLAPPFVGSFRSLLGTINFEVRAIKYVLFNLITNTMKYYAVV